MSIPTLITLAILGALAGLGVRVIRLERAARLRSEARVAALAALIDPPGRGSTPAVFDKRESVLAYDHLSLRVGLGSAAVIALLAGVLVLRWVYQPADAPAAPPPSLALMEMAHARQAETLQVSGRVRNQSETPADRITAVIAVFDKKGRAVASASAPIERQSLAPGDESPFTVAVPHVAEVGRYRVSFLNDAGLIRHIDRRTEATEQPATIAKK